MKPYRHILSIAVALLAFASVSAQQQDNNQNNNKSQEVVVRIQQDAPKPPEANKTVVQKADEWVEFGGKLGKAFDAGLTSLTDHADKFSKTDAGKFTMFVIAWKVMGKEATDLVHKIIVLPFGIVAWLIWLCMWIWVIRKYCRAYSVVKEMSGPFWNRTYKYEIMNEYDNDEKTGILAASTVVWAIGSCIIVFWLIT